MNDLQTVIDAAREAKACQNGLDWLSARLDRPPADILAELPTWHACWALANIPDAVAPWRDALIAAVCRLPYWAAALLRNPGEFQPTPDEQGMLVSAVCRDPRQAADLLRNPGKFQPTLDEHGRLFGTAVCGSPYYALQLLCNPGKFQASPNQRQTLIAAVCQWEFWAAEVLRKPGKFHPSADEQSLLFAASQNAVTTKQTEDTQ
jgi:hypothetical protein